MTHHPFIPGVELTKHHLLAKSRGGKGIPQNILRLWCYRHISWHRIMLKRNLTEIIFELDHIFDKFGHSNHWRIVFGDKTISQIRQLLIRVKRIKRNIKKRKVKEIY